MGTAIPRGLLKRWAGDPELGIAFRIDPQFLNSLPPGSSFQGICQPLITETIFQALFLLFNPTALTGQPLSHPRNSQSPSCSRADRYHEILHAFYSNRVSPPIHIRLGY